MTITFACPYCGKKLGAKETSVGKQKTCPKCGGRITVPSSGTAGRPATKSESEPGTAADHPLLLMPRRVVHRDLIDMTAMVDIVFFLLIFFLVTSLQSIQAVINLPGLQSATNAPESVQAVPDISNDADSVIVTIDADDAVWVDDEEALGEQDLRSKLRTAHQKNNRDRLMIKGAPESTHGTFVLVLDAGADAGMTEIQFSVPHAEEPAKGG